MTATKSNIRMQRRAQLLACAREVFAERGYHGSSIDDVIRAAGVARGTFYNYFESKRAVFQVVLEDLFEVIWTSISSIEVGGDRTVPDQIESNVRSLCSTLDDSHDHLRILFNEAAGLDPESDAALAKFYDRCHARLALAFRNGQALGFVVARDPDILALCIIGILKEYWSERARGAQMLPLDDFLAEVLGVLREGVLTV